MKIIAVVFEFATLNGGERSILAMIDWLRSHDSDLEFVAIGPSVGRLADALRERNIAHRHWSPFDTTGKRFGAEQIESSLQLVVSEIRPHLLHANSLSMGRLVGRLADRFDCPKTSHLRDIIKLSRSAIDDLNGNRKLVAVSKATRDFHLAQGLDDDRVVVIHNGVDLEQFKPRPASGRFRTELQLPPDVDEHGNQRPVRLIATIGQIGIRKGQDVLAEAAPSIAARIGNVHFVLAGERNSSKAESVEFESAVQEQFRSAGLSDRLHLLGYRNDIANLLDEIDLLIHPANQEPFGRVLLEASASGVPIIATDVGGTSEIVEDGVTGYLVPPRNPTALADAAVRVLSDDSLAHRLGDAAREKAIREFSISTAAERLAEFWCEVLDF